MKRRIRVIGDEFDEKNINKKRRHTFDGMRTADHSRLSHRWMLDKSRFYFRSSNPMPRYIEHIINPTCDEIKPIFVSVNSVSGEIIAWIWA